MYIEKSVKLVYIIFDFKLSMTYIWHIEHMIYQY